uniref:Dynamin-type G domain-containing protein n=1 Tax=viral metagenome TaxID=1070528 RepID=A0A6C0IY00_9ZZZZ
MSKITNAIVQSYTSVSNLWNGEIAELNLLENKKILEIGNVLNGLFINKKDIDIPRLVVVGSQSSGKSSVLNSIIGMDILPTGSNMVTRVPLQLELKQTNNKTTKAIFGNYNNGTWNNIEEIILTYPNITNQEKNTILKQVTKLTIDSAGDSMNISKNPIFLRIQGESIPNLTMIDLPGLTMVACTDKGQPIDIKDKIREMIGQYIYPKNTIILAVMPARTDIEADIALDIIKEYDYKGERTLGILTKLDLMNEETDITHLLENRVSKDLQLKYNYYGIKNRSKKEMTEYNCREGLELEKEYFKNHKIYSQSKYKSKLGINSLCNNLSLILINNIKQSFPKIIRDINEKIEINNELLLRLGTGIPENNSDKISFIHDLINNYTLKFKYILEHKGNSINTARNIKDTLINFREKINEIEPFNKKNLSEQYILESINNCEGNHMVSNIPPIEVLEKILKDKTKEFFFKIYEPAKNTVDIVMNELVSLGDILLEDIGILRIPNTCDLIKEKILNMLYGLNKKSLEAITSEINYQENYIWTDNLAFKNCLNSKNHNSNDIMRHLLKNYYNAFIEIMSDTIPKIIMYYMINNFLTIISKELYSIIKSKDIDFLLTEFDSIAEERNNLNMSNTDLNKALELIKNI